MDVTINPFEYENIKCPKCGGIVWTRGFLLKKIPGIRLGTGAEDQLIDLPVYQCAKCGEIFPDDRKLYKLDKDVSNGTASADAPKSPLIIS